MKCSATNANFLADSISVDVLIKINCINFIEKKNLLNKNKPSGTWSMEIHFLLLLKNYDVIRENL